jgi:hypothetical protein
MTFNLFLEVSPYLPIDFLSRDMPSEPIIINDVTGFRTNPDGFNRVPEFIVNQAFKNSFFTQVVLQKFYFTFY